MITKWKDRKPKERLIITLMKTQKFKVVEGNIIQRVIKIPTIISSPSSMFKNLNHPKAVMILHHKSQLIIHQTLLHRKAKTN